MRQFMTLIFQEDGIVRPLLPDLWHELSIGVAALPEYASSSLRAIDVSWRLTPAGKIDLNCAATGFWIDVARDGRVITDHDAAICVDGPRWQPTLADLEKCELAVQQYVSRSRTDVVGLPLVGSRDTYSILSIDGRPNIAAAPSVGLFWVAYELNSNWMFLITETCSLAAAEPKAGQLCCLADHDSVWKQLRSKTLQEIGGSGLPLTVVYDDYSQPRRGRVEYRPTTCQFTIYADRQLCNPLLKKAVVIAFNLAEQGHRFQFDDRHSTSDGG